MSFLDAVPAQREAVEYLNGVAKHLPAARIYVGGHSKGGNLAIYAAVHCEDEVRERIVRVYSNDGPGYRREMVDSEPYRRIEERIVNIIPQTSVIGRLLEHDSHYVVVHSSATGLWQHDGFSWDVLGTAFVPDEALTQESEMIDRSIKKWVADMSPEQREKVVDALYGILTATNAKTLSDLTSDRNWFWKMITGSDPEARKTVFGALSQLTGEAGRLWLESLLPALMKGKKQVGSLSSEASIPALPTEKKTTSPAQAKSLSARTAFKTCPPPKRVKKTLKGGARQTCAQADGVCKKANAATQRAMKAAKGVLLQAKATAKQTAACAKRVAACRVAKTKRRVVRNANHALTVVKAVTAKTPRLPHRENKI